MRFYAKLLTLLMIGLLMFSTIQCDQTQANGTHETGEKNEDEMEEKEELVPVETAPVMRGDISSSLLFSSNLETERMADVYSRIQGLVAAIHIEEGDYVRKGQMLLEMEPETYKMAETRAHLTYQQQEAAHRRMEAMHQKELISSEEFEQSKFSLDIARVGWEEAKLNLEYTRITSPISGVVGERHCRPGDRIQPSARLFQISNTDEIIAVVYVPEKEVDNVVKGQFAFLTSDYLGDKKFQGWVKRVSPVIDPNTGTFKVTVGVKNPDNTLKPGMFVNAHVITDLHESTLLIPKTAVVYENELMNVFVVRDSVAHKVLLNIGYQDYEKIEVLSELQDTDRVIVVGQFGLKDKTKIKVVAERDTL
ncbi:MAG: hypothetical protein B6244_08595 [Candidatus Cloacimonetes bacterium 4572_55]|nr:MAG: hypothetical protein B6244_08595 [Candidatus Cloacimonetes bacterium 4572_55]